ncbi:MAG: phosphatidate cytidylyltransferase [candidate division NC10 bacterium]|nr:phosphatidate cytidylyltransferase [candidate division NC10 bacterium]
MHHRRVLSAVLLIPAFLLFIHASSPLAFHLLVSVAVALAGWEFARLCPVQTGRGFGLLGAVAALLWQASLVRGSGAGLVTLALTGAALLRLLWTRAEFRSGAIQAAWLVLGAAYVGGFLGCAGLLRDQPAGRQLVYFLMLTTWAADTGAYYVGSTVGRRPLAPALSPKKTVEGAVGGLLATALTALIAGHWLLPALSWWAAVGLGLLLAAVGMAGDLCESGLKRAAGVKDSSGIIPGHGGILDRLDSLMFAGPCLYALVRLGWL